ncbi:MAG: hypothetical protein HY461_00305 [Parcubacteria group bacterium]|nr:hypothetical protein [Parcubacteria group bacterium]
MLYASLPLAIVIMLGCTSSEQKTEKLDKNPLIPEQKASTAPVTTPVVVKGTPTPEEAKQAVADAEGAMQAIIGHELQRYEKAGGNPNDIKVGQLNWEANRLVFSMIYPKGYASEYGDGSQALLVLYVLSTGDPLQVTQTDFWYPEEIGGTAFRLPMDRIELTGEWEINGVKGWNVAYRGIIPDELIYILLNNYGHCLMRYNVKAKNGPHSGWAHMDQSTYGPESKWRGHVVGHPEMVFGNSRSLDHNGDPVYSAMFFDPAWENLPPEEFKLPSRKAAEE